MKIGIDISQIVYGTGVSFYTKNLVENLLRIDQENEYRLFFSSLRQNLPADFKIQNKKTKIIKLPLPPTVSARRMPPPMPNWLTIPCG